MSPPFIVLEGADVELFNKAQDAELDMEPIDVSNGVYECYDATGKRLSVCVIRKENKGFWRRILFGPTRECVEISDTDFFPDPVGLAEKLRSYCLLVSQASAVSSLIASDLDEMSLKELIQTLQKNK